MSYPDTLDTEETLPTVHDSLRLRLAEDYNPGDTTIYVEGDLIVFNRFPNVGYLTLTEQCSDGQERAISFSYSSKLQDSEVLYSFSGLTLLDNFPDVVKLKKLTHVTQNVMAIYHNAMKDAIIAIEDFVGVKGTIDINPYGDTMEGRTNFLHKLVLQPRAWFSSDKRYGLIPLSVVFTNKSFQIGEGCPVNPVEFIWDFGDEDCSHISISEVTTCPSLISVASVVPVDQVDVRVVQFEGDPYSTSITKTYNKPGKYDVSLTVINRWGQDQIILPQYITARLPAPNEAQIDIIERSGQIKTAGVPTDGPPFTEFPKIRSAVNTFIDLEIQDGKKPGTESLYAPYGRTYGGEVLDAHASPIDPIVDYNWQLSDDLSHGNAKVARASYSIGGLYDVILRVDTEFDSYRITVYGDSIDIVERNNIWLWTFNEDNTGVNLSEFGLISETFKTRPITLTVVRDSSFLESQTNYEQLIREFNRNVFFSPRSSLSSGQAGNGLIYWSSGRNTDQSISYERIYVLEFNGFNDTYITPLINPELSRPWNWVGFNISPFSFFLFGNTTVAPAPNTSPTNQEKLTHNLSNLSVLTPSISPTDYIGGADELMENVCIFDPVTGQPYQGHFSVYRATTKSQVGYFVRNAGVGLFFRIKSFYNTEGTISDPIQRIKKLPDMLGTTKLEGQLVSLTSGIFFFDNSSSISAYNDTSGVWETGSSAADSPSFSSLQDRSVLGFSRFDNTLLATSDGDRKAYLSYDYSPNAFIKFSEASLSFSSLPSRPIGDQWLMTQY